MKKELSMEGNREGKRDGWPHKLPTNKSTDIWDFGSSVCPPTSSFFLYICYLLYSLCFLLKAFAALRFSYLNPVIHKGHAT